LIIGNNLRGFYFQGSIGVMLGTDSNIYDISVPLV